MLFFDLVDPAELTGAARVLPDPAGFVLNRYLPDITQLTVEYEITAASVTYGEAQFMGYDTPTPIGKRQAQLDTKRGNLPKVGNKYGVGEWERLQLQLLEGGTNGRLIQQAYDDTRLGALSIRRRIERARAHVLFNGVFSIEELEGGTITVDYGVDPANLGDSPNTLWSDPSADIWGDLEGWFEDYSDGTAAVKNIDGQYPGVLLTSKRVINAARKLTSVIKAVWGPLATAGNVTVEQLNQVMNDNGFPPFVAYDTKVEGVRLTPDDTIAFLPSDPRDLGRTLWGTTAEALELVNSNAVDFTLEDAPGVTACQIKTADPVSVWTKVNGVVMPIVDRADLLMTKKVL